MTTEKPKRNIYKIIAYAFLSIVALLLLIIALALSPVGVSLLVNIANDQDGINIENATGSFYSTLNIGAIKVDNAQISADIAQAEINIGLNCLFVGEACVDKIYSKHITVSLKQSSSPQEPTQSTNEYIELPLKASIQHLGFEQFSLYQADEKGEKTQMLSVEDLLLVANMQQTLNVEQLSVGQIDYYMVPSENEAAESSIDQNIHTSNNQHWLDKLYLIEYQAIELPEVFIPINAKLKQLEISKICVHQSDVVCTQNTQASLSALQQKVLLNLSSSPTEHALGDISLDLELDLTNQFAHNIALNLRPNIEYTSDQAMPIALSVEGEMGDISIDIQNRDKALNVVNAKLVFGIDKQALPLDIALTATQISQTINAWLPQQNVPVEALKLSLKGNTQRYEFDLNGSAVEFQNLTLQAQGNASLLDKQLVLQALSTSGDIGQLLASANINIEPKTAEDGSNQVQLSAQSDIQFNDLRLQKLIENVESDLSGEFALSAQVTPTSIWGELRCDDIKGQLQSYDLSMICDVALDKNGRVDINALSFEQGSNQINGSGHLQLPSGLSPDSVNTKNAQNKPAVQPSGFDLSHIEYANNTDSDLVLDIRIKQLSDLLPDAQGNINGQLNISGPASQPNINADLLLNDISVSGVTIDSGELVAKLDVANNWQSDIRLSVNSISGETKLADSINVSVLGDMYAHQADVKVVHPDYALEQSFSGGVDENTGKGSTPVEWQGKWLSGKIVTPFDSFSIQSEDDIDIALSQQSASLSPHCWVSAISAQSQSSDKAGLCLHSLNYQNNEAIVEGVLLYDLALPALYYAPELLKQGTELPLRSDVKLDYSASEGLNATAYSFISESKVVTSTYSIDVIAIVANFVLAKEQIKSSLFAGTQETGAFGLLSQLNLDPDNRTHSGQLKIDEFALNVLQRFIPGLEELDGKVVGNLNFEGELTKPIINGGLDVQNAQVVIDNYPYPITNFNQQVLIKENIADVNGEFDLGDGSAEYWSKVSFQDKLIVDGGINGAGMQIAFDKNELIASPNLSFSLNPEKLTLGGEIIVPNADIKIEELPESAKAPSSDTIIIGEAPPEPLLPIGLDIDLKILLDPSKLKRVRIRALDLEATLGSDLQVVVKQEKRPNDDSFAPMQTFVYGSVSTLSGSYEAYGQNLQIREGNIYFSGPPELPQFDINAIRNPLQTLDGVIAGIRVSGNPVVPKVDLFSEPAMIQARQLSYLVLGRDINGNAGEGTSSNVMLVNALVNAGIGNSENGINKLGRNLGFDSLSLQTAGSGSNTQVQVTGRISEDIQITYGVGLFDQSTEVILKYQFLPKLFLEAKSGAANAVDLIYEFSRNESQSSDDGE